MAAKALVVHVLSPSGACGVKELFRDAATYERSDGTSMWAGMCVV